MLSIENPPSADPHPCQAKKKNSVGYNEKKKLTNLPDLDPSLSSSIDHPHNHNRNQIPSFTIRDYVFTSRSKDVKKNWPFSLENLQLCFRHGIKYPLPPFQTLDAVKNQSSKTRTVETISNVEENLDDHQKPDNAQTNQKLTDHSRKCNPGAENELPSTSTSVYQSEIESLEDDQFMLKPTSVNPPWKSKTESTNKPTRKKFRLVLKIGSIQSEDIFSSSIAVSELMASSKTCPVCKIFSSSSNTTLNAHIDQCLSADSKPEMAFGTKLVRHKIKPRKIRLMTDIYATAKRCTLEELDRRNGTSRASLASSFPALETDKADLPDEGENQTVLPVSSNEVAADVSAVYIDASGTKVRILSKFDDAATVSKASKDIGPNKSLRFGKGEKFFSTKKKSRHGKKRHKYLKLVPQSGKLLSHKAHASQNSAAYNRSCDSSSSPRKKVSIGHQCEMEPKFDAFKRQSSINNSRLCLMDEEDEDLVAPQSGMDQECHLVDNSTDNHHENEMISNDTSFGTLVGTPKSSLMVSQYLHQEKVESTDSSFRADLDDSDDDDDNEDDSISDDDVLEDFDGPKPTERRATSLSKFLDREFHRLGTQPKTLSDSPQSADGYIWFSGGGEAHIPSIGTSFLGGQDMYSAHEDDDAILGDTARVGMEFDKVGQGSSFLEVEPILIPGPPGSFLPSPRNMGSDDFPANSSLTHLVQSCDDHRGFIDRNSSDSPVSFASTVSNSMAGKSDDVKYVEQFSSVVLTSVIEKSTSSFPRANVECAIDSSAESSQQMSTGDKRNSEGEKYGTAKLSFEKNPFGFRNDDLACSCQRKEKTSQVFIALNQQESELLRRRSIPNMDALRNFTVSGPEKVSIVPMRKLMADLSLSKRSSNVDCASSSSSASNPILRLMGKNLMVVNTEEDASMPLSHADFISKTNNPTPQFSASPCVSPPSFLTRDINTFHHMPPQHSVVFGRNRDGQGIFDAWNHFGNNINSMVPQNWAQVTFQNHCMSPFSSLKTPEPSVHGDVSGIQNTDFNAIPSRRGNASPVRLGCTSEGSGNIHRASALYFS